MNIHSKKSPLEVNLVGEAALSVLSAARHGCVLASVTDAIYLENQLGGLCWVVPMHAPMHQRALKIEAQPPRLSAGRQYQVVDHSLAIDSGEMLNFHHATSWKAPPLSDTDITPLPGFFASLSLVVDQILTLYPPKGLGCLLKPILQVTTQDLRDVNISFESKIVEKAWFHLRGIIQATREIDRELFNNHARSMMGLGEGLTPSGDDFLGGFFFSTSLLQKHYPEIVKLHLSNYFDDALVLKPLTNLISYTILIDHSKGHSVEPLHRLADGLLLGAPANTLVDHARRLVALGHSTGWDILTGFFAGMTVALVQ